MSRDTKVLSQLVKHLQSGDEDPLRPVLDAYMIERDRAPERYRGTFDLKPRPRPPGRLSPSSLGGCEREAAFRFLGVKGVRRLDPDQQLIFDDGEWRHRRWQATFKDMELVLGKERFEVLSIEQRVSYHRLYIDGSLDAVLRINGKRWVVDIKGINEAGWSFIHNNNKPLQKHVRQIISYMRARRVPRGLIWYEAKSSQMTLAFVVELDNEAWQDVESWCLSVVDYIERRKLPPKHSDCRHGTIYYQRCPFSKLCFGTKPIERIERRIFRDFEGIEEHWRKGQEAVRGEV